MSETNEGQRNEEAVVARHPAADAAPPGGEAAPGPPAPWPRAIRWPIALLLGLLFGVLFGLHVLDNELPWLAYVSTVPWLLLCAHPRLHGRFNLIPIAIGLHVLAMVGLYFLRGQNTATWVIAPLMYWPLFLLTWPLYRLVIRRWPRFPPALLWPLVFTGTEWLRIRLCPGELSLCHLAYSQIRRTRIVQVADIGGTGIVSFYLTAVAGLIGAFILSRTLFSERSARRRWLAPQLIGVVLFGAFIQLYGAARDTEEHFTEGPRVQVRQTNTARSREPEEILRVLDHQVLQTLSTMRPGEVDAVLWPENSVLLPVRVPGGFEEGLLEDLRGVVERTEAPLFFDSGWTTDEGLEYHSAYLLDRDGELQHHWKVRLLPWTEYAPLRGFFGLFGEGALEWWLGFIERFVGFVPVGSEAPLDAIHAMELRARDGSVYRFGAPICFEIATARVVNRWHRGEGIDFLVNPTSEGKLGDTVHFQTIAISGFRAVEGRVPVVRVTNDGISGVIDANGRPRDILRGRYTGSPINEAGVLFTTVPLDSRGPTIYARFGDWLPIGALLITLALAIAGLRARPTPRDARGD